MTTLQRITFFVLAFVMAWPVVFTFWLNATLLKDMIA